MITILSKNKYTKVKLNDDILDQYRNFFITNKEQWWTGPQLEAFIGKTCRRKFINKLRCEGLPIISDVNKGYKLTTNKDDIRKCYDKLRDRALTAITSAKLMKKYI